MLVFVLNQHGQPLMPCRPQKARNLLQTDKAKVVNQTPFTIKLRHGGSGYKQTIIGGMDTGSKTVGCAATTHGVVLYQSEVVIRQDVGRKMEQRAMYRRTRRGRKMRYRKPRWANRASMRAKGRLAPSLQSKVASHLREKQFVESILPVSRWKVETASFDIHKIADPEVSGKGYQEGGQKGFYNVKAFVLHRDGYRCQSGRKGLHSQKLQVHHINFRSKGGTDAPSNLIALCEHCHDALHRGEFELKARRSKTQHATEMGIIKSTLKTLWDFEETFGYETKYKREQYLALPKTHYFDAVAICCDEGEKVNLSRLVYQKRHVANGDYQQTTGKRSGKLIPTGKLFGLRKFDKIKTDNGTGFVKGKRSSGYFALMDVAGNSITTSTNVKKNTVRLSARTTTLTQRMEAAIPLGPKGPSILDGKRWIARGH